jgi:hypothetical protein
MGLQTERGFVTFAAMKRIFDWPEFLPAFERAAVSAGFVSEIFAETDCGPMIAWLCPGAGRRIYLSAGMHGDEPAGVLALLELMESGYFSAENDWVICPALNPTGLSVGTRENADGMDLNRDYRALQSREVKAHAAWLAAREVPSLFLSLHEDWESAGFYFYEINLGMDDPEVAQRILEAVKPWFPAESGPEIDGHATREPGWIFHQAEADEPDGWPEAIYLAKLGCERSLTFETPSSAELSQRVAAHCAAIKAACEWE